MAVSIEAKAVTMTTGRSSSMVFSSSSVAMPSMPGIITSTMAASNGIERASSMPWVPLVAIRTW